jgi:Fic family protein
VDSVFSPAIPSGGPLNRLKDLAQEVVRESYALEGRVAPLTAAALGETLRLLNSYHSGLIEGHKTTIPDIEKALNQEFSGDEEQCYARELGAAHVEAEREMMRRVLGGDTTNVCSPDFLRDIHRAFYSRLPPHHQCTQGPGGFTRFTVDPGRFRDKAVSVGNGASTIGPGPEVLADRVEEFSRVYDPARYHGDEGLIAAAASHHRLTWLHPFRDGNGRVARLFSGLYLARIGINTGNLWSLSRGFSRERRFYMLHLSAADSPSKNAKGFDEEELADFCSYFLEVCLDQIRFMTDLVGLERIESRIDWYVETRSRDRGNPLKPEAARLLRALFTRGELPRGEASKVMNMSERSARRVVSQILKEGLAESDSHRAPLRIALPTRALPFYFPNLYDVPVGD